MGEALGIDLRAGAGAAVRWRDGRAEVCEVGDRRWDGHADVIADLLGEVARRAGRGPDEPVGVTHRLDPDGGARGAVEQAAAAAFGRALVVGRPLATAAFVARASGDAPGRALAVVEVTGTAIECALVRVDRDGVALVAPPAALPEAGVDDDVTRHLDRAVALLDGLLAGGGERSGVERVLVAGASPWLDQLALQLRLGTGLAVDLPDDAATAAAAGAALLAAEPDRRGGAVAAAVAGLGAPVVVAAGSGRAATPATPVGEAADAAIGEAASLGEVAGRAVGEVAGRAVGEVAGRAVGEAGAGSLGAGVGAVLRGVDVPGEAVGAALGRAAAERPRTPGRGKVVAAALAAAAGALVVLGVLQAGRGGRSAASDEVEAVADSTGERSSTTRARGTGRTTTTAGEPPVSTTTETAPAGPTLPTTTVARGEPGDEPGGGSPGGGTPGSGGGSPAPTPGPTTAGPATTAPPGTSSPPPDTAGPVLSELVANPSTIQEHVWEFCEVDTTAILSVRATDPSGVASVTGSWSGGGTSGALTFQPVGGGTWQATLQVEGAPITSGQQAALTWSATATDGVGNASSATGPPITLLGC